MAYNDSIPTTAIQPYGGEALGQGVHDIASALGAYLNHQVETKQKLQQDIALKVAEAKAEAWGKQQDPIARALTMGKLGEMGYPTGGMQSGSGIDIGSMLQGNPYADMVGANSPQSASMPQQAQQQSPTAPSTNDMPSGGGMPMSPMAGNGQWTPMTGERNPFTNGVMPKTFSNIGAKVGESAGTSYGDKIAQSKAQEDTAYSALDAMTNNLTSSLKGAMIQAGGGGPAQALAGGAAAAMGLPNTGLIKGMSEVKRSTAIQMARTLAGGSQGVQKLFERVLETLPDTGFTPEQAGTTIAEMKFTGLALKTAFDKLGITPEAANKLSDSDIQHLVEEGKAQLGPEAQQQLYGNIAQQFSGISPRQQVDLEGNVTEPKVNPISGFFGMKYNPIANGKNAGNAAPTASNPKVQAMVSQYKQKYPGRSDQEIMAAMQKQGLM